MGRFLSLGPAFFSPVHPLGASLPALKAQNSLSLARSATTFPLQRGKANHV